MYRETDESRLRGSVRHYASTSTRVDLSQMRSGAAGLVDAGLRHLARPVATCGHAVPDPRLLPGFAVAAATAMLVVMMMFLLDSPVELLLVVVPLVVCDLCLARYARCARRPRTGNIAAGAH